MKSGDAAATVLGTMWPVSQGRSKPMPVISVESRSSLFHSCVHVALKSMLKIMFNPNATLALCTFLNDND
jgi:hypothetical protein